MNRFAPGQLTERMAEFDLMLERPGKWTLQGHTLPDNGLWYTRQAHAMIYAALRAKGYQTVIVRLHHRWKGPS
jgi:hypothetical protein